MRILARMIMVFALVFGAVACYLASAYTRSYPENARDIWA